MTKAYVNYPNPKFRIHRNPSCTYVGRMEKPEQRHIRIDTDSASTELRRFANNQHIFSSNAESNDMWLDIEFEDADFEMSVLKYVCRLIGKHYAPLAGVKPTIHC